MIGLIGQKGLKQKIIIDRQDDLHIIIKKKKKNWHSIKHCQYT